MYTVSRYSDTNEFLREFCLVPWERERRMGRCWTAGLLVKQESETWGGGKGEHYFCKSRSSLASEYI